MLIGGAVRLVVQTGSESWAKTPAAEASKTKTTEINEDFIRSTFWRKFQAWIDRLLGRSVYFGDGEFAGEELVVVVLHIDAIVHIDVRKPQDVVGKGS